MLGRRNLGSENSEVATLGATYTTTPDPPTAARPTKWWEERGTLVDSPDATDQKTVAREALVGRRRNLGSEASEVAPPPPLLDMHPLLLRYKVALTRPFV